MKPKGPFAQAVEELPARNSPRADARPARARPGSGPSDEYSLRYGQLREVLTHHLSPILVDSVLQRALEKRGTSPRDLTGPALSELTGDIMLGLRLFVPEDQLAELMLELAEILAADHG